MKSLEIVNERIDYLEGKLKSSYELSNGHPISFNKQLVDAYEKCLDNCKQVKQDLEILEILNNKNVEIGFLKFLLSRETDLNEVLEGYNYGGIGKKYLSMEELLKLKQWLEVNEK